jgi:hypothetical protein
MANLSLPLRWVVAVPVAKGVETLRPGWMVFVCDACEGGSSFCPGRARISASCTFSRHQTLRVTDKILLNG